jgi:uncharacterized membrane protein
MTQPHRLLHRFISSRPHLSLAAALGVAVVILLPGTGSPLTRALIGWNAAVWVYLLSMAWMMLRASPGKVRQVAGKEDESAGMVLSTLTIGAVLSLSAIIVELSQVPQLPEQQKILRYGFTAMTVGGSWLLVGVLFCFHYAHLFYRASGQSLPLRFPDDLRDPDYWDFLYFSFTIAVAVQTSDVAVMTRGMRRLVLGHSVLAFFFNLAILGLSINIAAGLLNQ